MTSPLASPLELGPEQSFPLGALADREPDGQPRVAQIVPPGFDRYVRIFHPALYGDPRRSNEAPIPARSWASLAKEARVDFDAELSLLSLAAVQEPYWVAEGNLDEPARSALFRLLSAATPAAPALFYYGLGAIVRGGVAILLRAAPEAFAEVQAEADADVGEPVYGPEFVWSVDRSWVVSTDYDLPSTYVGCSDALAEAILADPVLEALPVALATRVGR